MVETHTELEASERFQTSATRRDFLGMAAAWSAIVAFVMAMLGALRLPMPSVFPESNSRVKLGRPDRFQAGTSTYFPKQRLWLYRGEEGFHAISSVCTHLGCVAERDDDGKFVCPCHGSEFDEVGKATAGPHRYVVPWDLGHGRQLFESNCVGCHGTEGRGSWAPELNNEGFLAAATDGFLQATIVRGRKGTAMRPFGRGTHGLTDLSSEDIDDIVAYIRHWSTLAPSPMTLPAERSLEPSPKTEDITWAEPRGDDRSPDLDPHKTHTPGSVATVVPPLGE